MSTENNLQPRRPLRAITASLIMPGLGQIYNGDFTKGLVLFLITAFSVPFFAWFSINITRTTHTWIILLGVSFSCAAYVFSVKDAYRRARLFQEAYQLHSLNRAYIYVAFTFIGYFFVLSPLTRATKHHLIESYHIPSGSMSPTLLEGDLFFVDKSINQIGSIHKLKRGDIVVFVNPNERTQIFVKRLVGLPGDKIPLDPSDSNKTLTVPNGQAFLLGDNRQNSVDSRKIGTIPLVDIIGRAEQIWFSKARDGTIRWQRIGLHL